jgi:hypothetical protein
LIKERKMMSEKEYVPFPLYWDSAPLDLSFLYKEEAPAGKHGFLKVRDDKFVFADGTAARFWGVNMNSGSIFPDHNQSELIAERLAHFGVNLVRMHQIDGDWATPNIFQFSKSELLENTRSLDPRSMERLDYFVYCLKEKGIYIYFDMLSYRKFRTGDGVDQADKLQLGGKPHVIHDEKLIELQKEFCKNLWTHVNPFTKLAYKDEPAIAVTELLNECDLFFCPPDDVEPYKSEIIAKFIHWASKRGLDVKKAMVNLSKPDRALREFYCELQTVFNQEMKAYLRSLGVKIPICGNNWTTTPETTKSNAVCDFMENHPYWVDWFGWDDGRNFDPRSMVKEKGNFLPYAICNRLLDKPFFVSEWDSMWPNEWRAEAPLLMAATGLLQGWSGLVEHAYRYSNHNKNPNLVGKEFYSLAIGGSCRREGTMSIYNDPAKMGLFYHAALMFRRGDVQESKKSVAIQFDDLYSDGLNGWYNPWNKESMEKLPAFTLTAEFCKAGVALPGEKVTADRTVKPGEKVVDDSQGQVTSDTGQIYRNWKKGLGWIDTPMSKVVYGFYKDGENVFLNGFSAQVKNDFAVVAISSLTDEPITSSRNMLLTTVGRAENTNLEFNEDRTAIVDFGQEPIMIEVIKAQIIITTSCETLIVKSVNSEGFVCGTIPSEYTNGELKFELGQKWKSMYYLIQAE